MLTEGDGVNKSKKCVDVIYEIPLKKHLVRETDETNRPFLGFHEKTNHEAMQIKMWLKMYACACNALKFNCVTTHIRGHLLAEKTDTGAALLLVSHRMPSL